MPHFERTKPAPNVSGGYASFRPYVREDFRRQCAYCLVGVLLAAGVENFELDLFRPKKAFPQLKEDFYNLYYACHPCNRIKWDSWPPPDLEARGISFVDLCTDEFAMHFRSLADGTWDGLTESGKYTIEMLRLNREHLVEARRLLRQLSIDLLDKTSTQSGLTQMTKEKSVTEGSKP
jgi:hypothetical protein